MGAVGRLLTLLVVVVLVLAVWVILVALDYDLDPTLLQAKQTLAENAYAALLLLGLLQACPLLRRLLPFPGPAPQTLLSPLALTCARLC